MLQSLGVDPAPILAKVGLHAEELADAEGFIPLGKAAQLVAKATDASGNSAFPLLVGALAEIRHLGPLGRYLAAAPDLRSAIEDIVLYHPRYVRGGGPYLMDWAAGGLLVGYRTHDPGIVGASHLACGAMAFGYRIFSAVSGVEPRSVLIALPQPTDVSGFRSVFKSSKVIFNAPHFGLAYSDADLRVALPGSNPALRTSLGKSLAARWGAHEPDIRERVLRALVPLTLSGIHSLESTAARLSLSPSELNRELRKRGCSFRELHNESRFEMACQMLADARLSIAEVSSALGYSEMSAFSRFFTSMSGGVPPSEWRYARNQSDGPEMRGRTESQAHTKRQIQ
jgi:AraC-like DNA-binding protein